MIQESAKGNFQMLIVHKLDRFARNRNDSIAYRMKLQRNKVALLSVLEPFDEDRPETILLQSVIEGMNEFYSRNLAREVRKGLKENALHCKHTGGSPPLGYDVDPSSRLLVVNEREAEAVRLIFRMVLEGNGYSSIITRLQHDGYKTKTNKTFGKNFPFTKFFIIQNTRESMCTTGPAPLIRTQRSAIPIWKTCQKI